MRNTAPAFLSLLALPGAMAAQSGIFTGTEEHDGGKGIRDFELADLDADGVLDLAATAWDTKEISVQLGLAGGGFAGKVSYAANAPKSIDVLDANQDGHLDVLHCWSGAFSGPNVGLWLGSASGALTFHGTLSSPGIPAEAVAADFDLDGFHDVATFSGEGVFLARGQGAAAFAPFAAVGSYVPFSVLDIAAGDTTGDGAPDLVAGVLDHSVLVFAGAAGGVVPFATLSACSGPQALAVVDVSGDGLADIALGCSPAPGGPEPVENALSLFVADGAGGWSLQPGQPLVGRPWAIAAGDFDADGLRDVAVATELDYAVFRGTVAGLAPFGAWVGGKCEGGCWEPVQVAFHDTDGDGDADLLAADGGLRTYPWLGKTFGGPRLWRAGPLEDGVGPRDVAALDLDGDGKAELVAAQPGGLGLLVQDGMGGAQPVLALPGGGSLWQLHTVQLDGDGVPDLLSYGQSPPAVHAQLGQASLGLGPPTSQALPIPFKVEDSVAADFDGDGAADIALALDGEVRVIASDGAGGFRLPLSIPFDEPRADAVAAGDLDLDGFVDLAAIGTELLYDWGGVVYTDPKWRVFLGDGAGGFSLGSSSPGFELDLSAEDLALADLNADGKADMLALGSFSQTLGPDQPRLRVYPGDGHGGFGEKADYSPSLLALRVLWVADLTGDGRADVLTGGTSYVGLMTQTPGGGFAAPQLTYGGMTNAQGILADLNGDGWLDLARAHSQTVQGGVDPQVSVLWHAGAGALASLPFGTGTPGCFGSMGLSSTKTPTVGASDFALVGSNVAPSALGSGFLGTVPDFAGSDPFGLGLTLHIGLSGPLIPFAIQAGAGGEARAALPIPSDPALKGQPFFAQALWLPPASQGCGSAFAGFTVSRGLRLVIQ